MRKKSEIQSKSYVKQLQFDKTFSREEKEQVVLLRNRAMHLEGVRSPGSRGKGVKMIF
jgi:hypothetical protein